MVALADLLPRAWMRMAAAGGMVSAVALAAAGASAGGATPLPLASPTTSPPVASPSAAASTSAPGTAAATPPAASPAPASGTAPGQAASPSPGLTLAAASTPPAASDAPAGASAAPTGGSSFTYNGLEYAATGLLVRPYPGDQTNSGTYWIVSDSITDTATTPIAVPAAQSLLLFGPGGTETAADATLGGAAPTTLNPGITFTSYEVFNVPAGASPSAYTLGFVPYQVVGGQYYAAAPLVMALPPSGSSTVKTPLGASYELQNMFGSPTQSTSEQTLTLSDVVKTNAVAPDLTAPSFDPSTSFWVVDFTLTNKTSGDIAIAAGNFSLDFNGEESLAPDRIASLPGFVPPTGLQNADGVTVPTAGTFTGSLLFVLPAGTATDNPALQFTSPNGQTRIISLTPCQPGSCPPVLG